MEHESPTQSDPADAPSPDAVAPVKRKGGRPPTKKRCPAGHPLLHPDGRGIRLDEPESPPCARCAAGEAPAKRAAPFSIEKGGTPPTGESVHALALRAGEAGPQLATLYRGLVYPVAALALKKRYGLDLAKIPVRYMQHGPTGVSEEVDGTADAAIIRALGELTAMYAPNLFGHPALIPAASLAITGFAVVTLVAESESTKPAEPKAETPIATG